MAVWPAGPDHKPDRTADRSIRRFVATRRLLRVEGYIVTAAAAEGLFRARAAVRDERQRRAGQRLPIGRGLPHTPPLPQPATPAARHPYGRGPRGRSLQGTHIAVLATSGCQRRQARRGSARAAPPAHTGILHHDCTVQSASGAGRGRPWPAVEPLRPLTRMNVSHISHTLTHNNSNIIAYHVVSAG